MADVFLFFVGVLPSTSGVSEPRFWPLDLGVEAREELADFVCLNGMLPFAEARVAGISAVVDECD